MEFKKRTPEARLAYLQGYQAAVRHAAEIAEKDPFSSGMAVEIWKLAGFAKIFEPTKAER